MHIFFQLQQKPVQISDVGFCDGLEVLVQPAKLIDVSSDLGVCQKHQALYLEEFVVKKIRFARCPCQPQGAYRFVSDAVGVYATARFSDTTSVKQRGFAAIA